MGFTHQYIASTEEYKGFMLEVVMTQSFNNPSRYHKRCNIYSCLTGECLGTAKTKKELKDLIDHNIYVPW